MKSLQGTNTTDSIDSIGHELYSHKEEGTGIYIASEPFLNMKEGPPGASLQMSTVQFKEPLAHPID